MHPQCFNRLSQPQSNGYIQTASATKPIFTHTASTTKPVFPLTKKIKRESCCNLSFYLFIFPSWAFARISSSLQKQRNYRVLTVTRHCVRNFTTVLFKAIGRTYTKRWLCAELAQTTDTWIELSLYLKKLVMISSPKIKKKVKKEINANMPSPRAHAKCKRITWKIPRPEGKEKTNKCPCTNARVVPGTTCWLSWGDEEHGRVMLPNQ
jgi:hypothetical protein